jgi:hypothetical protein
MRITSWIQVLAAAGAIGCAEEPQGDGQVGLSVRAAQTLPAGVSARYDLALWRQSPTDPSQFTRTINLQDKAANAPDDGFGGVFPCKGITKVAVTARLVDGAGATLATGSDTQVVRCAPAWTPQVSMRIDLALPLDAAFTGVSVTIDSVAVEASAGIIDPDQAFTTFLVENRAQNLYLAPAGGPLALETVTLGDQIGPDGKTTQTYFNTQWTVPALQDFHYETYVAGYDDPMISASGLRSGRTLVHYVLDRTAGVATASATTEAGVVSLRDDPFAPVAFVVNGMGAAPGEVQIQCDATIIGVSAPDPSAVNATSKIDYWARDATGKVLDIMAKGGVDLGNGSFAVLLELEDDPGATYAARCQLAPTAACETDAPGSSFFKLYTLDQLLPP